MNKHLNLAGIILSLIVNLLVCFSAVFNFFLPIIYADYSINFVGLYIVDPLVLVLGAASLVMSVMLLLSFTKLCKNFKHGVILPFILMGLNVLTLILYTIFVMLYGWGLVALNGLIIFTLLTVATIFLIIGNLTFTQNKVATTEKKENHASQHDAHEQTSQKAENVISPEDDLENKLQILSSMKNMGMVTEEEFSEIKKKLVYDYLNKKSHG